jgi:hypothetical protein
MIFKGIGVIVCGQAASFSGDMKLGHYMKVPPRIMFTAQTIAVFISCFIVEGVQSAMLANIPDICTPGQKSGYTCVSTNTFATASLVWGGIGPRRLFSPGAMYAYPFLNLHSSSVTFPHRYHKLLLFLPFGALAPIPFYFLSPTQFGDTSTCQSYSLGLQRYRPPQDQLRLLGYHRIHLQLLLAPKTLPLVDIVQLHPLRRTGLGSDSEHDSHLLCVAAPQRWDQFELVGEYSWTEYG